MSNLTTAAVLDDPVVSAHPLVEEEPDWRDRGASAEMATPLWHGDDHDFGALTRFGMGWGPLEVQRTSRSVHRDTERVTRVLTVVLSGTPAVRVTTTDEHLDDVTIFDEDADESDVLTTPATATTLRTLAPAAVRYDERRYASDEVVPPVDAYVETVTPSNNGDDDERLEHALQLSRSIQEILTPKRRESRYVPVSAIALVDELHELLTRAAGR
jgi:hypothetical protein